LQRTQKNTIHSYIDEILKNKKTLLHASKQEGKDIKKKIENLKQEVERLKNDSGIALTAGAINPDNYMLADSVFDSKNNNFFRAGDDGINPFNGLNNSHIINNSDKIK
jgi:seryl-tRNA synthetase